MTNRSGRRTAEDPDPAITRCYDMLKKNGRIIAAEGALSDDPSVIRWYEGMSKFKEERLTFIRGALVRRLRRAGLNNITVREYTMRNPIIRNWLTDSGPGLRRQKIIMDLHMPAGERIKGLYNTRCDGGDCLIDTKSVILSGEKAGKGIRRR